jgi:hypothetical protein
MGRLDMSHWEFTECPEWRNLPHLREQVKTEIKPIHCAVWEDLRQPAFDQYYHEEQAANKRLSRKIQRKNLQRF